VNAGARRPGRHTPVTYQREKYHKKPVAQPSFVAGRIADAKSAPQMDLWSVVSSGPVAAFVLEKLLFVPAWAPTETAFLSRTPTVPAGSRVTDESGGSGRALQERWCKIPA